LWLTSEGYAVFLHFQVVFIVISGSGGSRFKRL